MQHKFAAEFGSDVTPLKLVPRIGIVGGGVGIETGDFPKYV